MHYCSLNIAAWWSWPILLELNPTFCSMKKPKTCHSYGIFACFAVKNSHKSSEPSGRANCSGQHRQYRLSFWCIFTGTLLCSRLPNLTLKQSGNGRPPSMARVFTYLFTYICLLIFRFLYMIFYIFECAKLRWSTAEGETGSLPRGGCNCFRCVLRKQAMTGKWKEGATKNSFADLKRTWFGLWRNSWIRSILSNPIITL